MDLVKNFVTALQKKVELHSKSCLEKSGWPPKLLQAALYSLQGGKKIRPLFFLSLLPLKKPTFITKSFLDVSSAIEFIHTYSLIQDDLPSMDNDDLRRGRKTLHKAFSESIALLTSDALLTKAFEILAHLKNVTAEQQLRLVKLFSTYAGGDELIHGQYLDLFENDPKNLEKAFIKKTSSLFILPLLSAATFLKKTPEKSLYVLGTKMGLLYQYLNDYANLIDPRYKKKFSPMHACTSYSQPKLCAIIKKLYNEVMDLIDALPLKNPAFFKSLVIFFCKIPLECHE